MSTSYVESLGVMYSLVNGIATSTDGWREVKIKNAEVGRYLVHKDGKVLDLKTNKLRSINDNGYGYKVVSMLDTRNNVTRNFYLHRIVAHEFCAGYAEGLEVNHINEDREDNRADNLEWVTSKQNTKHSIGTGRVNGKKRGSTNQTTIEHRKSVVGKLCGKDSLSSIADSIELPRQTVSSIVNGRSSRGSMVSLIEGNGCTYGGCRCKHYLDVLTYKKESSERFNW